MIEELKIGVAGYCPPSRFDEDEALRMLREAYDTLEEDYPGRDKAMVSGLTDAGVLALAYREASERGWRTVGIAPSKSAGYGCFPVDEAIIVGEEWGDESTAFIDSIDVLVRVGGGAQSLSEAAEMRARGKRVIEYDLPRLPDEE